MKKSEGGVENYALDARAKPHRVKATLQRSMPVSIKLLVLYPRPIDEEVFEQIYHDQHMPLMRRLITPAGRTPTYRVRLPADAPFYRMAEVHFDCLTDLEAFATSEEGKRARHSSAAVSTGGKPLVLVCERDSL
jgi:uncharacterized protein (TIGR02118 family)